CLSRVTPLTASTMASRRSINLLNKVDFPTLGRPTMATIFLIRQSKVWATKIDFLAQLLRACIKFNLKRTQIYVLRSKCGFRPDGPSDFSQIHGKWFSVLPLSGFPLKGQKLLRCN